MAKRTHAGIGRRAAKPEGAPDQEPRTVPATGEKDVVLSFRVDRGLAEALNRLPDRSAFIRRAILRAFYHVCPACQGRGVLPEPTAKAIEEFTARRLPLRCECCGFAYPPEKDHRGGKFVCRDCAGHERVVATPPA